MFLRNISVAVFVLSFFVAVFAQQQESLTITTYYPSPFGSYNELTVASRIAVGDVNHDGIVDNGDLAVSGQVNLVPLRGSLVVANRIGINTINPQATLDVNGAIRSSGPIFPGGQSHGIRRMVFGSVRLGPTGLNPTSTGVGFTLSDPVHNSTTSCSKVNFNTAFNGVPHVLVSRNSTSTNHYQWEVGAYNASKSSFNICATYCSLSDCTSGHSWNTGYVRVSFMAME